MTEAPVREPLSAEERARILAELCREWADLRVLTEVSEMTPYECDGLSVVREMPLAVVLPQNEEQVCRVLKTCHRLNVPVVARGSGTGLTGSSKPVPDGIVLAMGAFNRILHIDRLARTATVQAGVRNLAVSEAAAPHGLFYAPDPSSQLACSIGGNISQNSGGLHCVKYGLTTNNVLKIRAALMDGTIIEIGGTAPDAAGLDLLPLFIGSEGMFGVVIEAVLKLLPLPKTAKVMQVSFDDMGKAGEAVANVIAAGVIPSSLEMMDGAATRAVEDFLQAGLDKTAEAVLLCESDGTAEEVEEEIARMDVIFRESGATNIRVSRNEVERVAIWAARKSVFPAAGRLAPDYYCMDGTIPRRRISDMLDYIGKLSERYGLRCVNVFHAGDGNMHPLILFSNQNGEWPAAEAFGVDIMEECVRLGGTITGEHGVGVEKLDGMCSQFSVAERETMWGVKFAFDPDCLLNPDKALPVKVRCTEYQSRKTGAPSVIDRFPDLERF